MRERTQATTIPVTLKDIHGKNPNRLFFVTDKCRSASQFISSSMNSVYKTLQTLFSIQGMSFETFKQSAWPVLSSGLAYVVGHYATTIMNTETDEYDHWLKLMIGTMILGMSMTHRYTERRLQSHAAIASEAIAIVYLHEASFRLTRLALTPYISDVYALIASLGVSALGIPSLTSQAAKKWQKHAVKRLNAEGAQRSDTAAISSGMTRLMNTYLQVGDALQREMKHPSRLFQGGLIAFNILNENTPWTKGKNAPALALDVVFPIYEFLVEQQNRINQDFTFNTATQAVFRFMNGKATQVNVARADLKIDDLVYCDERFDLTSTPISGELIALQTDEKGQFTHEQVMEEYTINLKAKNGEDVSYLRKTSVTPICDLKQVDLQAIRSGQQTGILTASKLDLFDKKNFFVRVKAEHGKTHTSDYKKEAIINDYIMQSKNNSVKHAIMASLLFAIVFDHDLFTAPKWMFTVFQMMIAFSEAFARKKVNDVLIKELNQFLPKNLRLEITDVLRIIDFLYAIAGFYKDRFPGGAVMISDKTGTLTKSGMEVLGCWTDDMDSNVSALFADEKSTRLSVNADKRRMLAELFVSAYTNKPKELETEEYAIRSFLADQKIEFTVEAKGNSHFVKTFSDGITKKVLETYHLGLSIKLGGRFTLVKDGDKKYLVFFGAPRPDAFKDTNLSKAYQTMLPRTGVLSRDWCVARTEISDAQFADFLTLFYEKTTDQAPEELENPALLSGMMHYGTFIINNPIKKGAENFIKQCRDMDVIPVIATGDSAKASQNIGRVLCHADIEDMVVIKRDQAIPSMAEFAGKKIIIFTGLTESAFMILDHVMALSPKARPTIIFSEMRETDKGELALYLKNKGYFIAVNGDGSNDLNMMYHAHTVFAHLTENGSYAPGVEQFANLNDRQLQYLRNSDQSFYELFDVDKTRSVFSQLFARIANSQVKLWMGLNLKTTKIGWELFKELGASVKEVTYKHPKGMVFDLIWLGGTIEATLATADHPADNKNLALSDYPLKSMLASVCYMMLQASLCYLSGESVNERWMLAALCLLPIVLRSIYTAFGSTHKEVNAAVSVISRKHAVMFQNPSQIVPKEGVYEPTSALTA